MTVKEVLYDWGGLNVSWFQAINHASGEFLRPLAYVGNIAGDYWGMPLVFCALLLLAQRADFLSAARLLLQAQRLLVGFLFAWLSAGLLKIWLGFPRPLTVLGADVQMIGVPHDLYSLPSGHAVYAALAVVVFWRLVTPVFRPLLMAYMVWVGWARIAGGAHFPADVVAGGLIGILSGMLANRVVLPSPGNGNSTSIRRAFNRILRQTKDVFAAGELARASTLLQDAHVLGQYMFWPHFLSHLWMLRIAYARRDWREMRGQLLRLAVVPIGNIMGRLPLGNTGDANVSAFKPMPVPIRLKKILEKKYDQ
ncbi:DUF3703 domain-containing protein [Herminiimonas arsenitoxidans]|uniref:DUF3703 domain-containing protein n=1 Tax=Herminiimonas arsenitoxidans TaxID=1809410 RepID=UPI000970A50F|nr:DUF3703 domain-containing protein [Herminiimonas arsenitoxidans]